MESSKIIFLFCTCLALAQAAPWEPTPRSGDQNWMNRHYDWVLNTAQNPGIPLLFFGASWTEWFRSEGRATWDNRYAPFGATNYAYAGDRTENIHWRILNGEIQGLNPKVVVLGGDGCSNNFGDGSSTNDDIVAGHAYMIQTLRQRLPNTKILLLALFPRADGNGLFERTVDLNIKISKLADGNLIRYVNLLDTFASSFGAVEQSIYWDDKLHFNGEGYAAWGRGMNEVFLKMMLE